MTPTITRTVTRRGILKALGIGAAAAIIEEPARKLWFVGSNAPVGSRIERAGVVGASMIEEVATVPREELLLKLWTKVKSQQDLDSLRLAARLAEALPEFDRVKLMDDYVAGLKAQKRLMYNCIAWDPAEEYEANHPNNQQGTIVLAG